LFETLDCRVTMEITNCFVGRCKIAGICSLLQNWHRNRQC